MLLDLATSDRSLSSPSPTTGTSKWELKGRCRAPVRYAPLQTGHVQSCFQLHLIYGSSIICKKLHHLRASGPPTEAPKRGSSQNYEGKKSKLSLGPFRESLLWSFVVTDVRCIMGGDEKPETNSLATEPTYLDTWRITRLESRSTCLSS